MKNPWLIFLVLVLTLVLSACASTPVPPSDPSVVKTECVAPESDSDYRWAMGACVNVSTTVYKVTVRVADDMESHTEIGASGSAFMYGGYGSASYRMWQEGKGLLPVEILDLDPSLESIPVGSLIVLKTSDLKAMAIPNDASAVFICNLDTEVLSPVQNVQVLTTDRLTYELDDCRMLTPVYSLPTTP